MMVLRIAQGLVHLGKGTMTLNPFHSDRQLLCPTAVAALLTTCLAFIDSEHSEFELNDPRTKININNSDPQYPSTLFAFHIGGRNSTPDVDYRRP